jgi:hypothetical protein
MQQCRVRVGRPIPRPLVGGDGNSPLSYQEDRALGLSLICTSELCFAKYVPGHRRVDVTVAGPPCDRHRLVHREQPEYIVVRVIAGRWGWSQVARLAETVSPGRRFSWHLALGQAPAGRVNVREHPVHEAALNRSVRIINEQDQPGGPLGHAVPDQGRG